MHEVPVSRQYNRVQESGLSQDVPVQRYNLLRGRGVDGRVQQVRLCPRASAVLEERMHLHGGRGESEAWNSRTSTRERELSLLGC